MKKRPDSRQSCRLQNIPYSQFKLINKGIRLYKKELQALVSTPSTIQNFCKDILSQTSIQNTKAYTKLSKEDKPFFLKEMSHEILDQVFNDLLVQIIERTPSLINSLAKTKKLPLAQKRRLEKSIGDKLYLYFETYLREVVRAQVAPTLLIYTKEKLTINYSA
ncbi:hypothetical protein DID77_02035 [Candidatus Marinamargulisbacteria bacterium SCGC AG-439-L15]|nr:hypothetical protein DID77_02035 [Candidatus Marinamargulisbacteria bacterium SCGC AG-439-L15]